MKQISATIFYLCVVFLLHTQCKLGSPESEITVFNLADGEKNRKEFLLSNLVDDVEYVQLESLPECYVTRADFDVSENYIVVAHKYRPPQVMLFDRQGRFLNLIGKQGKGPGEYVSRYAYAWISKHESWILVYDFDGMALLQYSLDGEHIRTYKQLNRSQDRISQLAITPDDQIVLFMYRPQGAVTDYPLVRILDAQFEVIEESYHISKGESTDYSTSGRAEIIQSGNELSFREPYYDTLCMKEGLDYRPSYVFIMHEPRPQAYYDKGSDDFNRIVWLNKVGKYFIAHGTLAGGEGTICTYYCDIETGEVIRPITDNNLNDVDGIGEYFTDIELGENFMVDPIQIIDLKEAIDTADLNQKVLLPDKRDALIRMAKEAKVEDNAILRLFRVR
jgi:hypothetical protein